MLHIVIAICRRVIRFVPAVLLILSMNGVAAPDAVQAAPALAHMRGANALVLPVHHVAPHTCGVSSSKFARICRPAARTSCDSAVTRGVKGYSSTFCAARSAACSSCLAALKVCIKRIGHGPRNQFSCDECTGKFSRCIGKRYPKLPG